MTEERGHRVLVVDDDPFVRRSLCRMLESDGYEVVEAEDGSEALARIVDAEPDLVVTDLLMPDMDGIELIRAISESKPPVPIIAVSGGGRVDATSYLRMASHLGASAVIAKPVRRERLLSVLAEVIGRETPTEPPPETPE